MSRQLDLESLTADARFNAQAISRGRPEDARLDDSTLLSIKTAITGPEEIEALLIELEQGRHWWMTRLYFLCSLAADLTTIEPVVFVGTKKRFLGVANPQIVRERLALHHPVLAVYERTVARTRSRLPDLEAEVDRRAGVWTREMAKVGGEHVAPVFVTPSALNRWLRPYVITEAVEWATDGSAALQMQRLLDWPLRFVPVVERGRFVRIVDKHSLTEQIARLFVREQVSRALSTIR
jgi:hypothetical protein